MTEFILDLRSVGLADTSVVGGKNASLGEMISHLHGAGVRIPPGFATTADAYRAFLSETGLASQIYARLSSVDVDDVSELASAGRDVRGMFGGCDLGSALGEEILAAYAGLGDDVPVAVRSSATAEDLPEASFAGQQETFLNVSGGHQVLEAVRDVFSSLFTDRAIAYRAHHGFDHSTVAISAGIQRMVRADLATSGVAFTIDTETGFEDVLLVTSSYGLGELLVQGAVNPDEFYVYKPNLAEGRPAVIQRRLGSKERKMVYDTGGDGVVSVPVAADDRSRFSLSDDDLEALSRQAVAIEEHYGRPMDVEWAFDGVDGHLYILQARPETVQSRPTAQVLETYRLRSRGRVLTAGRSVGQRIGTGPARVVGDPGEMSRVQAGDVLVADMTDPDWEPVMKRAAAIVTNRGGRTCHAAIIARELEIPAVVGTSDATETIADGTVVTVSCAEGDSGYVYEGALEFDHVKTPLDRMPDAPLKMMMNVGSPERAFAASRLPNDGVGLARLEFVINNVIGIHPRALLDRDELPGELRTAIDERTKGYPDATTFFVEKLKEGIATIAAAFAPKPVIVRLSDFKSNEYARLLGGDRYEPREENPMIGFRGAARYRSALFAEPFALECRALREVRHDLGFSNVEVMVPFVRTPEEAAEVVQVLASHGLERGVDGLRLIMMCEIPSNALLAEEFLELFDGFSIGSNDLTQFALALDRDSELVAPLFNERHPAVKALIELAVRACKSQGKYIGICGQGPSDHPDLARWLADLGLDSLSLNPDTVVSTWLYLAGVDLDRD